MGARGNSWFSHHHPLASTSQNLTSPLTYTYTAHTPQLQALSLALTPLTHLSLQLGIPNIPTIPHLRSKTTNPNTAKMTNAVRSTASKNPTSDAASTRSSSSFASTISLMKEKRADKKADKAKKQAVSTTGIARYASTMINQC